MRKRLSPLLFMALLAVCVMAHGCSTNQYNIAAKSIITAQEVYGATMSATADAYGSGILSESGKAEVIKYGTVAHDGIALAQVSLLTALDVRTSEAERSLEAAVSAMKHHLFALIDVAVSFGVSISDTVTSYRKE